jgi:hypothetical protein
MNQAPQTLYGMKVVVTPDLPKMKLGPGDYITPELRLEIDAWLLGFFGTTNIIEDDAYLISDFLGQVMMNPRTYVRLRRETI